MSKSCGFFGHRYVSAQKELKQELIDILIDLIENKDVRTFYVGQRGDFEFLTYNTLIELQEKYPDIQIVLVISYPEELHKTELKIDDFIYPVTAQCVYKRFAISYRNQWVAEQSDYIIAYVKYEQGGAYQSLKMAKRFGKNIILCGQGN